MTTSNRHLGLKRCALGVAICVLFVILIGAAVTSYQPISPSAPAPAVQASLERWHRMAGFVTTALVLGLAAWLTLARGTGAARWVGWTVLAAVIADVGLGEAAAPKTSAAIGFVHALLAHLFFAGCAALVVLIGIGDKQPELVDDRFSIRAMALFAPILVTIQIALGAAYRHKLMGVLTHIFGALVVAVYVLLVGVLSVKQYPTHRAIRPAAITLMSITGVQVLLGFAAFIIRLVTNDPTTTVVISTVSHVVTGALTLAASVVLAIQIRRHVRAANAAWSEAGAKIASS